MTDDELIDAYHEAMVGYEAAKAGTGDRLETFARILVAEKVLAARLGRIDLDWTGPDALFTIGRTTTRPSEKCRRCGPANLSGPMSRVGTRKSSARPR